MCERNEVETTARREEREEGEEGVFGLVRNLGFIFSLVLAPASYPEVAS
jgi:hypothetical protein